MPGPVPDPPAADLTPLAPLARIKRIRNCPPFVDFQWSTDLDDLKRFVVIYGPNGCGKTTFSEVLGALENGGLLPHNGAKATLTFRDDAGNLVDLHVPNPGGTSPSVRTYSTSRINDYLGTIDRGGLPVNLVLGKGQADVQRELEEARKELAASESALEGERRTMGHAARNQDDKAKSVARTIKEALAGVPGYLTYQKGKVWENWNAISGAPKRTKPEQLAGFLSRAKELAGTGVPHLQLPHDLEQFIKDLEALEEPPSGGQRTPAEHNWLVEGLRLHEGRHENCLYCENQVTEARRASLQGLVDDETSKFRGKVEALIKRAESNREAIQRIEAPDSSDIRQGARVAFVAAIKEFEATKAAMSDGLVASVSFLRGLLADKAGNKPENGQKSYKLSASVATINVAIDEHNRIVQQHASEVATAAKQYEAAMAHDSWLDLDGERLAASSAQKKAKALEEDVRAAKAKVSELEASRLSPEISATELTHDLAAYFGRKDIEIRTNPENPTMYQILRKGETEPAKRLSDGERRAISFVYFLETLRADGVDRGRTVVVIDDPVNSMDEQSIYHAQHFMREKTHGIGQTIVLTHNFPFFRLLRRDALTRKKDDSNLLMLTASGNPRTAQLRRLHPFLRNFDSDYHYLFYQVWDVAQEDGAAYDETALERHLAMPNQARRLMEAFGSFLFPGHEDTSAGATIDAIIATTKDSDKHAVVEAAKSGGAIKAFLNHRSHQVGIGTHDPDPVTFVDCPVRMKELLILMEHIAPHHVAGLKKKCRKLANALDGG